MSAEDTTTPPSGEAEIVETDKHGFLLSSSDLNVSRTSTSSQSALKKQLAVLRKREGKWRKMLDNWSVSMESKADKIKSRCRKGIPDSLRGRVWLHLCGANLLREQHPLVFDDLVKRAMDVAADDPIQQYFEIIDKDLNRTFPHHEMFAGQNAFGQREMSQILRAYALYNPALGYCQGMGMLAGTLLMHMTTEDAFWCLVALLTQKQYLSGFFESGLKEVQIVLIVARHLLDQHVTKGSQKLLGEGMEPILYMTDWFMCAYVKTLPWDSVLRIWDMFMFEGVKVLYKVAVTIMALNEAHILQECKDLHAMMVLLRALPHNTTDANVLIPHVLKMKIETKELDALRVLAEQEYDRTHPPKKEPEAKKEPEVKKEPETAPPAPLPDTPAVADPPSVANPPAVSPITDATPSEAQPIPIATPAPAPAPAPSADVASLEESSESEGEESDPAPVPSDPTPSAPLVADENNTTAVPDNNTDSNNSNNSNQDETGAAPSKTLNAEEEVVPKSDLYQLDETGAVWV